MLTKTGNSNAETADVSVEIDPVLSLTLTEDEITLNPTPTPEGTFVYDTLSAIVDTNNKTGYTLTMNTEAEETALAQEDGVTKIDSLANEVTVTSENQSNFTMNHWGYALTDTLTDSETSFLKIPALSTPDTIKTSDAPVSDDTTPVTLATRVDTSLPSGTYKNTLVFSATANFIPDPTDPIGNAFHDAGKQKVDGYYLMQDMTADICNSVSTPDKTETTVPEITLKDSRDNELYTVRKLADGNCWMTQNLRLVGPMTLTPDDTDIEANFDIPSALSDFKENWDESRVEIALPNEDPTYGRGAYYSWGAVTARGSVFIDTNTSICPKGWQLPDHKNNHFVNKSFGNLIINTYNITNDYDGVMALQSYPFDFTNSMVSPYTNSYDKDRGQYWTSSTYNGTGSYILLVESYAGPYTPRYSYSMLGDETGAYLSSVRCVAR